MKFKVGDRVKCFKENPRGLTGTILRVDSDYECLVDFDEHFLGAHDAWGAKNGWYCTEEILKLVKEQNTFKVGDRVKAIKAPDHKEGLVGQCGVVIDINDSETFLPIEVRFDSGIQLCCEIESLEKIEIEKVEFKVGARVKATGSIPKGLEGTIVKYHKDDWWLVEFDKGFPGGHNGDHFLNNKRGYYMKEHSMKLIGTPALGATSVLASLGQAFAKMAETLNPYSKDILEVPAGYYFVARDKDGNLFAYEEKPVIDIGGTQWYGKHFKVINKKLFAGLNWGDEPLKIEK